MIRNLKILIAAAMALAAFGAIGATGAQAAEFHCSVQPCQLTLKTDGTGKTAHHVFVISGKTSAGAAASASFTCESLNGESTQTSKTVTEATFKNLAYSNCTVAGSAVTVVTTGCTYTFTNAGKVTLACEAGKAITLSISGTECVRVNPLSTTGIKYHDAGTKKEELTAEVLNLVLEPSKVELKNTTNANCKAVGLASVEKAEYTTGNTIITAETDPGTTMASVWFE